MRGFGEAYSDEAIVQQLVGRIPWGHNIVLLDKLKDPAEAIGIAEYQLTELLPGPLRGSLPTVEELERELGRAESFGTLPHSFRNDPSNGKPSDAAT